MLASFSVSDTDKHGIFRSFSGTCSLDTPPADVVTRLILDPSVICDILSSSLVPRVTIIVSGSTDPDTTVCNFDRRKVKHLGYLTAMRLNGSG